MKKLTALLLGTVISIAFNADAFAGNPAMDYWNSNDGKTGSYLGVSGQLGSTSDVTAGYARLRPESNWNLESGFGAKIQYGYDFGKLRLDWRLGALNSEVGSIDNDPLEIGTSDNAVLGYTTFNIDLDLYRFELINRDPVNIAITPFVGAGAGYGGGWMTGKKDGDDLERGLTTSTVGSGLTFKRDAAGHGFVYTVEAGILLDLTDWAGITLGYNYLDMNLKDSNLYSHLGSVGLRFTY